MLDQKREVQALSPSLVNEFQTKERKINNNKFALELRTFLLKE